MTVSPEHRRIFERQAAALREEESDDEGSPEFQRAMIEAENQRRAEVGQARLLEWWEDKTEGELHERARALGLLERVRRAP